MIQWRTICIWLWRRILGLNLGLQSQILLCYHYTISLCGIPSRTRTYKTLVLSQRCLPVSSWGYVALGSGFEPLTLWLTARCSTIELPKNKWRMAQDLNLWSSINDFSLAKRHDKPLCQPSIWSREQELNLYLPHPCRCAVVTPSLDILPPYSPCCIFRPPKDCNLDVLCLYTSIRIGGRCYSVPVVA